MTRRKWMRIAVHCVQNVEEHRILAFSAAQSFYLVLSFFPALVALSAMVAYLPVPDLFNTIVSAMAEVMPPESMHLVRRVVHDIISPYRGSLLSVGLLGAIWSASGGFANIIDALNIACTVRETRPFWKTRLWAIAFTLVSGGLIAIAFSLVIVGGQIGEWLASHTGTDRIFLFFLPSVRHLLALTFVILAIVAIYKFAPNVSYTFRQTLPGAILAVAGWLLLSAVLHLYFAKFAQLNHTYGVLGGAVALLLWLYLTSFVILVGAELNAEMIRASETEDQPSPVSKGP
jgi:membrane protein